MSEQKENPIDADFQRSLADWMGKLEKALSGGKTKAIACVIVDENGDMMEHLGYIGQSVVLLGALDLMQAALRFRLLGVHSHGEMSPHDHE